MKKNTIREKIERALEMPLELLKNIPRVTLIGNENVLIENYKSIVEYEKNIIRVSNNVCILGEELNVYELSAEELIVTGKIKSIEV